MRTRFSGVQYQPGLEGSPVTKGPSTQGAALDAPVSGCQASGRSASGAQMPSVHEHLARSRERLAARQPT